VKVPKTAVSPAKSTAPPATTATSTTPASPTKVVSTPTRTVTAPTHTVTAPTRTVTVTKPTAPRTVTRYVSKTVAPDVPDGAFLPSKHRALTQKRFTVPGDNVGCAFAAGSVRCDIEQRTWVPPRSPATCSAGWGNALILHGAAAADFACGGTPATSAGAHVVPDGWDDTVGKITCQVRRFAVDCFSTSGHGFIVSRTGYLLF
jgi:hypothetical protein